MSAGRTDASRSESGRDDLQSALEPLRPSLTTYFRRRVRQTAEVEDLVQDVFARILARDSEHPVEHVASYIFQTAASVLADRHRRRLARHADAHTEFDAERHAGRDFEPDRLVYGKQELKLATATLLLLPERTRTVFILHRLEGWKCREIAERLGISVSAVEKHMMRAVRHVAEAMERTLG